VEAKLQDYYDKAKAAGACEEALEVIRKAGTVEAFLKDEKIAAYLGWYACNVIKDRWPEAEPIIMQNAAWTYWYARYAIKDRWPEAEPLIMKNAAYAYRYACSVMQGRWLEAEPIIMKDVLCAYGYARDVMKERWTEAEPYIVKDNEYTDYYCEHFNITRGEMNSGG
jgi:hypothetical protein